MGNYLGNQEEVEENIGYMPGRDIFLRNQYGDDAMDING